LLVVLLLVTAPCRACFSIVVGKNASADGCVIVAHNEDDGPPQVVNHHKVQRRTYPTGATVRLRNGGTLEQAKQTWAYLWSEMPGMLFSDSYVNEWGVTVTSDNCPSREDTPEMSDGGIGYMLRRLVAERAETAREGVLLAGRLVERFGYIDSGRTYIIGDPDEGWLFCVVHGKHWMARRVPDDEVAMVANTYTIRQVDLSDTDSFLACDDIVDYATQRGWYDPQTHGPFDFAAVYASPQAAGHPSNTGRQWSGLTCITDRAIEAGPDLPFSVVPRHKLSVPDVMGILRHDKNDETGSVPVDSRLVCALCSGATQTSFVARLRPDLPREIGIVYWVSLASPRTSFFLPFHFGMDDFPAGFRAQCNRPSGAMYDRLVKSPFKPDASQAFWAFSNFREKIVDSDGAASAAVRARAEEFERDAMAMQRLLEPVASTEYQTSKRTATRLLSNYSRGLYLSSLEEMHALLADN
jgi:dipeptidase